MGTLCTQPLVLRYACRTQRKKDALSELLFTIDERFLNAALLLRALLFKLR